MAVHGEGISDMNGRLDSDLYTEINRMALDGRQMSFMPIPSKKGREAALLAAGVEPPTEAGSALAAGNS